MSNSKTSPSVAEAIIAPIVHAPKHEFRAILSELVKLTNAATVNDVETFMGEDQADSLADKQECTIQVIHIHSALKVLTMVDGKKLALVRRVITESTAAIINETRIRNMSELKTQLASIVDVDIDEKHIDDRAAIVFHFLLNEIPLSEL